MKRLRSWIIRPAALFVWFYCQLVLVLMGMEDIMVYPGGGRTTGRCPLPYEESLLTTSDGESLVAWYFPCPANLRRGESGENPVVLFCHGNGANLLTWWSVVPDWQQHLGADVLLFDYRGYGRSTGRPSELGVVTDAKAAYRFLSDRGIRADRIVLVGKSLGGAVAIALAQDVGYRALCLESTFTSLPDTAACQYPWIPVHWLMRNHFPSAKRIGSLSGPVVIHHGEADGLVPVEQSRRLFELAPEPKRLIISPRLGHDDAPPRGYFDALRVLLEQTAKSRVIAPKTKD